MTINRCLVRALVLGATVALCASVGRAQWCGNPADPCDPNSPASKCYDPNPPDPKCETCPDACRKSPCYVGSGSYTTEATDLQIRTVGFPLVASRRYDSTHAIDGPLGFGWTSSLTPKLYYATYLFAAPSTYQKEADILMPSGWMLRYVDAGGGSFTPPNPRKDVLVRNGDGTFDLTVQRSLSVYHFGADGKLLWAKDDYSNTLTYTYDGSGRLQQVADAAGSGRYLNVFWGGDGRISSVQDSTGRSIQYFYNAQGALTTAVNPLSQSTTYAYQTGRHSPLLAQIKDNWSRIVSDVTYDATDRVHTYTEAGETYTYTYAYGGSPTTASKSDSQGNHFVYAFAPGGLVTDTTPPSDGPAATHYTFYPDGSVESFTDGAGAFMGYAYTSNGSPLQVARYLNTPQTSTFLVRHDYAYDPNFPHRPISITPKHLDNSVDYDWQAWQYDYYQAGSLAPGALYRAYRIQSDGTTRDTLATYVYNSHGQVTSQSSATGAQTDYAYDTGGNLISVTAPSNNDGGARPVTQYGYDALGRVTSVTDALLHVTTYTYDYLDRMASVTLPKPSIGSSLTFLTTYGYDNFDPVTGLVFAQVTDPNVLVTKQGYDQFGQLVRGVDALNNVTYYSYTRGLLTSLTDTNGNATSYAYDSGRRLVKTTFTDGAFESYVYTGDSLLALKTDRKGQQIGYVYDGFKRLLAKYYPSSTGITYTYVGQKLTQAVDQMVTPNETHTFSYDPSYRVASNLQPYRGTISYTYNTDDTVASYALFGGLSTNYTYYPDGSLNTIVWSPVTGQFKYAYSLLGQYQTISFPNGQGRNFTFDDQGRLLQLSNLASGGGNLATYAYGYDWNYTSGAYTRLGQRVSMTATVPSQGFNNHVTTYEYDSLYQLTKATYPNVAPFSGEVDSWTYDAVGNRLTNTVNGGTQTYTYQKIGANPNNWQRLLSDGTNSYTYDANGNAATMIGGGGSFTLGFDKMDRLSTITGGVTASYVYDYQGRRSSRAVAGTTYPYMYNGLNMLSEGYAPTAGSFLYGPGIDEPLAMLKNSQVYYYGVDSLGSVNVMADASGAVQNKYVTDVWGASKSQAEAVANPLGYTAREKAEAGSLFYRARYYSPSIGRFLSEEWSQGTDFHNTYPYVGSDPAYWVDPSGLARVLCPKPIIVPTENTTNYCIQGEVPIYNSNVPFNPNYARDKYWCWLQKFDEACKKSAHGRHIEVRGPQLGGFGAANQGANGLPEYSYSCCVTK